jgi:hypothetical protein
VNTPRARAYRAAALLAAAGALLTASCSVSLGLGVGAGRHVGHHTYVGGGVGVSVPLSAGVEPLAARLFAGGERRLPAGEQPYQRSPAVAYGRGTYLLGWQQGWHGAGGAGDVVAARLDESGRRRDRRPLVVCAETGAQDSPDAAFCAGRFLVAWSDLRNGTDYDVYAALVDLEGKVAPPGGFLLAGGPGGQARPAVASDGTGAFLVVWQHSTGKGQFEIRGARVSAPDGRVLDDPPLAIMPRGEEPDAVWTGSGYLVCQKWYAATLGADGKPAVASAKAGGVTRVWHTRSVLSPAATAAWGRGFAFMNTEPRHDPWGWGGGGAIIGVSVDPAGGSPELEALGGKRVSDAAKADGRVRNCLDAARWRNHPGWPSGMPGGFKSTHEGTWPSGRVAAAWNGRSILVAWTRAHIADKSRLTNRDLYLRRVTREWSYPDAGKIAVATGPTDETNPALAAGAPGRAILAWERVLPEGGMEIRYRLLLEEEDRRGPRAACTRRWSDSEMSLVFDEPVDPESASQAANYRMGGAEVLSAKFDEDPRTLGREVRLETSPLVRGKRYVLRVTGVRDSSERGNAAAGEAFKFTAKPGTSAQGAFVESWAVVGPFEHDWESSPREIAERFRQAGGGKRLECAGGAILVLSKEFGEKEGLTAFARTHLYSDQSRDALLRIDATDGHRAWLNGRRVSLDRRGMERGRGLHDRTDEVEVGLRRGWNQLLVQHSNRFGRWQLVVQVTDLERRPLRDLAWQLEPPAR